MTSTFRLLNEHAIPALNITLQEYEHSATGAKHIHLAADNSENVFLVGLRTIPTDSSGVAHILEHTALCGSEHFPVRDPFFMMLRRSLNTFMNAFTSSDWTAYPFATQNRKDYDNLLSVYLDAVFFSRLDPLDFAQEGHRLALTDPNDSNSPLVYKGVVYNEMKGAMSSPVSQLWHTLTKYLYPETTYHFNSGGEPSDIPNLSYEALQSFYKQHYHPSNAIFMTYGDIPAAQIQKQFQQAVLSHFEKSDRQLTIPDEKRYAATLRVEEAYPYDDEGETSQKTHIVLSWLLGHSSDHDALLRAQLLSGVLLDNSASPLLKALETTDLGKSPSPLCGLEDTNKEMCFMCGIEGSDPQHADALEKLVLDVIRDVADNGVPAEQVEAVLHQLELNNREVTGGQYPYGLQLILGALPAAIHRGDIAYALDLDKTLVPLREQSQDPKFIKQLARDLLLDNHHRVRLTLRPEKKLTQRSEQAQQQKLAKLKQQFTAEEIETIKQRNIELDQRQQQIDDPNILPKVTLEDIPREVKNIQAGNIDVPGIHYYPQATNGLVYHDAIINFPKLSADMIAYLPYLTDCITELGCGDKDYLATQAWQAQVSGGIAASTYINTQLADHTVGQAYFVLAGKALTSHHQAFTELMHETLTAVRFDEQSRLQELVAQMRAAHNQSITQRGHSLAMTAASSGLNPIGALSHQLFGLEGIKSLNALDDRLKKAEHLKDFAESLSSLHQQFIAAPRQLLFVSQDEHQTQCLDDIQQYWKNMPAQSTQADFNFEAKQSAQQQMWITNSQVNFCAKAYATVGPEHPDAPVFDVLAGFLRNGFLHRVIREQGGAYGGGASNETDLGIFRFYSYRDPRLAETLNDFDAALDWLQTEKHEWQPVEEAILGVISIIDKPRSPAGEAKKDFYNRCFARDKAYREAYRDRVLQVTLADLQRVANEYLKPAQAHTAVVSHAAMLEQQGDQGMEVIHLL